MPERRADTSKKRAARVADVLKRVFGIERLRAGQRTVIDQVLAGRPTLAIMPTGAGKSLCYQLPALLLPGRTVVVSPLIALMKDQVEALRDLGIAAVQLNSAVDSEEAHAATSASRTATRWNAWCSTRRPAGAAGACCWNTSKASPRSSAAATATTACASRGRRKCWSARSTNRRRASKWTTGLRARCSRLGMW
ncbi:DEAD/DEAH box helicase [Ramlibacter humi]|uniref:DNA 3'-5' helicase n=1 Tax=Ramlibacter humi TaxID=2530451 RepID=A0A4Z0BJN4_9BURK|nr:DEAD/DEAH box helicase [Ramlibacter humi]